ncbi:hypothetical protein ACR2Y7_10955, partial [Klebsiella pneumoniae]
SLKTSIKNITYLSDIGCLEIQGASLICEVTFSTENYGRSLSFSRIHSLFTLGCNDIYRLETS